MPETKLQKPLGGIDVFCISAGAMISSGIFLLPGLAFSHIGPAIYIAYILAGIFAFLGTLATIELATAMPLAGGIYYYIERSLGPMVGTVSGLLNWCAIAFKTAFAIFGMSEVMYQLFGGIPEWWAVGLTLVFVGVNLIGTQAAAWMQLIMVIFLLGIMAAFIVGGALSVAGLIYQAVLRNPLAEPFVLGVSGGAGLAAVAAVWSGLTLTMVWALPAAALGALLATAADVAALKKPFGVFLLVAGLYTVFSKIPRED